MRNAIQSNDIKYAESVRMASAPIAHCVTPSARTGSRKRSARVRTQKAPSESPRMKAESINSNECVALPSTSESMRTHAISQTKLESAVPAVTISNTRQSIGSSGDGALLSAECAGVGTVPGSPCSCASRTAPNTVSPTRRLMIAAVRIVPGSPATPMR